MSANEIPTSPTITRHYRVRFTIFPPPPVGPFSAITSGITPFSIVSRVARYTLFGTWILLSRNCFRPLPLPLPPPPRAVPSFPLLPSLYCSPPLLLLLLLLGPSSETTVVQRERRIRPKCIGSCGRVLFPFNRANAFRITFRETAGRSASPRGRFPAPGDNRV